MKSILIALLLTGSAHAASTTVKDAKTLEGSYAMENVLKDSGLEGDVRANWTVSGGTLTSTTTAANVARGSKSGSWDSNGASQILASVAVAIPAGLYGRNGEASVLLKCNSGTCTHLLQAYDGTNILVSTTVTSALTFTRSRVNFIFPSSGNIQLRVVSVAADEPTIFFDDAFLGEARNSAQVSQAQFIGSASFATTAACTGWTRSSTTIGAFASDTDCPGPVVDLNPGPGTIQTTDADLPKVTVNSLPPGYYEVSFAGGFANSNESYLAVNDGTTTSVNSDIGVAATGGFHIKAYFNYTTAGNRTFELYGSSRSASALTLSTGDTGTTGAKGLVFSIVRYPNTTEQAFRPDQSPASWSGYHTNGATWAKTTTATYADFTATGTAVLVERTNRNFGTVTTAASNLPGITFLPPRAGRYQICASAPVYGSGGGNAAIRLFDGTTAIAESQYNSTSTVSRPLCGIWNAASIVSTTVKLQTTNSGITANLDSLATGSTALIEWSILELDAPLPAPYLVGSVVNNSSGVTNELYAVLNCDSSSAITSQSGTTAIGVATIGNISSGVCAGTFAGMWSGTPVCVANAKGATLDQTVRIDATSSTAFSLYCIVASTGVAATTCDASVICVGPK